VFDLILYRPEIPPNTGNIIRLCANTGTRLHLVRPLGFSLADRYLRRAGLDYHELAQVTEHESLEACLATLRGRRLFALSTRGTTSYAGISYTAGDVFLMGPETSGLPATILENLPPERLLRIPMRAGSRSLNLSNAAAVVIYEAWRQGGFPGAC
jgi:tRNA (cytidine/uridine-2'-O-)-methyltransferase